VDLNVKAIEIRNLSKVYRRAQSSSNGEIRALSDVTLDIKEGEFVTIFGPNGCGKTTLLLCVAGVEEPSNGTILVNGRPPSEALTGFVFQNYREALLPWRSCLSNIAFPLEIAGWSTKERHEKARALVSRLNLNIDLDSYPYQQSGGQQQLVAIARALVSEPDVLVLDEPLSALDMNARFRMRTIIESLWIRTKKTILHVTHDLEEAIFLADRIIVLSNRPGKVLKEVKVTLPRPRNTMFSNSDYGVIRSKILSTYETDGGDL